jgi:NADP-dependent 3-hydroxy acid dehydrogenase YdfG
MPIFSVSQSIGPMTDITNFLRNGEQRIYDFNTPWSILCDTVVCEASHASEQPGKVINISSVHEELPFPHFTSYCARKGAVE